jgi:peptidoglycan/LPS O-acetylase OafA/YrhL
MSYVLPNVGGTLNHLLLAILYSLLILIAVADFLPFLTKLLSNGFLVWLGYRSYAIYLFHGGVLS